MTSSLEKVFFSYILKNKKYFEVVKPHFFMNAEIQLIYNVIRDYIVKNNDADVPSPRQILEMVSLEDKNGTITKEILKAALTVNLDEYDEKNFIEPRFYGWVMTNRLKTGTIDIVDEVRNFDGSSDFEAAVESSNKIKSIIDEVSSTNFINDDNLGSDFDNADDHVQDSSRFKVKSGFETIDHMLGGGWDESSLSIIMAETSQGKSLWMQNFAFKSADLGYNVLYITLEMSERKVLKRIGSMRLKIPINDYDVLSKDIEFIKKKIKSIGANSREGGDLFTNKLGKIYTKFWAAGTATISDFDNFIQKIQRNKGIKFNLLIVDYITLISAPKGVGDTLYLKGKHLAEGLRALAAKYKCPVVTAIQVAKDAWNANDITLESIPESKAIAETADTFFVIIRTEEMKRQNLYRFKLLKQRDGDFLRSQIKMNLNSTYLTLEGDQFVDGVNR